MAPRNGNQPGNSEAEQIVGDNLDLDLTDAGLGTGGADDDQLDQDDGSGLDDDSDDDDVFSIKGLEGDDEDDGQQQQRRVSHTAPKPKPKAPAKKDGVKPDKDGNLVNAKGEIVARRGAQARLYQRAERHKRELTGVQTELSTARQRLGQAAQLLQRLNGENQRYKATQEAFKQFNLTPQDQLAALNLFVDLRDKPQEAIKRILTRAAAHGINVAEIGQNGGIDAKSLTDLIAGKINEAIAPIKSHTDEQKRRDEQLQREQEDQQVAREEVANFFRRHPEAVQYATVFRRAMADPRYRDWSLPELWVEISARASRQEQRQNGRRRTPGSGSIPRGSSSVPRDTNPVAHPNESYERIIDQVLTDARMPR